MRLECSAVLWSVSLLVVIVALVVSGAPIGARGSAGGEVGTSALTRSAAAAQPGAAQPAATETLASVGLTPTLSGFSWTKSTSLTFSSYELASSTTGASGPWTEVQNLTAAGDNASWVNGMTPGTTTWWQATAWSNDIIEMLGTASNVVAVTQPAVAVLNATTPSPTSVTLNWTNNATYAGNLSFGQYSIYQSTSGGAPAVAATVTDSSTRSYTASGLSAGTSYSFYLATQDRGSTAGEPHNYTTDSNTVNLGTPVALSASASAQPGTVDVGQIVSLSCVATGGTGPYVFNWSFGDGTPNSTGSIVDHAYADPGPYTAHCTTTDAVHSIVSSAVAVAVSPADGVVASVDHAAAAPGTWLNFSATPSGGPGPYSSFLWNFGDGATAAGPNGSYQYPSTGHFDASVTVTDGNGATATAYTAVVITNVTAAPTVNRTSVLPGDSLSYSAAASGGAGGPFTYSWSYGDGASGSGSAAAHTFEKPGNFTATMTATDALGASATFTVATVEVFANLSQHIVLGATSAMPGQKVALNATISGGSGPYTCHWQLGNGATQTGCAGTYAWSRAGTYSVNLTVSDPLAGNLTSSAKMTVAAASVPGPIVTPASHPSSGTPAWVWWAIVGAVIVVLLAIVYAVRRYGTRPGPAPAPAAPADEKSCSYCGATLGARALRCPKCGKAAMSPKLLTGHKPEP
jgi:PKD repeat protein